MGTTIFRQLTAVDKDTGRNGDILYRVVPGDGSIVRVESNNYDLSAIFKYTLYIYVYMYMYYEWFGFLSQLDGSLKFEIAQSRLGLLTVSSQLDFESLSDVGRTEYILNISASDDSISEAKRTSFTTIRVTVTDGDDRGPAFEYSTCTRHRDVCVDARYEAEVRSNQVEGRLNVRPESIRARDGDTLNTPVRYSIIGGKHTQH